MPTPFASRRHFLRQTTLATVAGLTGNSLVRAAEESEVTLPFANGKRRLAKYPQKRALIVHTSRPVQLETPFSVFNEDIITANDAFFVRYHNANIPLSVDTATYRLEVKGSVNTPLSLSLADLKSNYEQVEVIAVNQCSGNSRGFFQPRVGGGQLANGAMGNAKWRGPRLKDVLDKAGIKADARQVVCNGLDTSVLPQTPDFIKALEIDQARDGEIILATEMNGQPLPMLNGFPLRLVVPGYFGTYWIKHLNELNVVTDAFAGFYMATGYRIPATPGGCVEPGTVPASTVPINRFKIRSFLTSLTEGATVQPGRAVVLRGIAFDSGAGITEVQVSTDAGQAWQSAALGKDHGKYSFREWTFPWTPKKAGVAVLQCRAFNRIGETQPHDPLWNPSGYMRNVIESTNVTVA